MVNQSTYPVSMRWVLKSVLVIGVVVLLSWFGAVRGGADFLGAQLSLPMYELVIVMLGIVGVLYMVLTLRAFSFSLQDTGMVSQQGFFSRSRNTLLYSSVQDVLIRRSLLDRLLGLSTVVVQLANQRGASFYYQHGFVNDVFVCGFRMGVLIIPGLSPQDAQVLKETIMAKSGKQ